MGFLLSWSDNVLDLDLKTHVMGILNVTPDSFSDGGQYLESNTGYRAWVHNGPGRG